MVELRVKVGLSNYLQEEVDRYDSPSTLSVQITRLKVSLVEGEKRWKKASRDAAQVCHAFEAGRKVLQQKKDDQSML